jgi:hypothetical protein
VPLLGFRRGLSGELYYDMLHGWTGDPWTDPRAFAGNGDGTLLYPSARGWERRPEAWLRARRVLGDAVARQAPRAER